MTTEFDLHRLQDDGGPLAAEFDYDDADDFDECVRESHADLVAENERLRGVVQSLSERCHAQALLLARRSERAEADAANIADPPGGEA